MTSKTHYNLWVAGDKRVSLNYDMPDHLAGSKDIEDMRSKDLEAFDYELMQVGSSIDKKKDEGVIWRMGFPGMILDVNNVYVKSNGDVELRVRPIHPHRADLSFKADNTFYRNVTPLTIAGLMRDKSGVPVLGIRGGDVSNGSVAIIPGGHVDYEMLPVTNVVDALKREYIEEIGMVWDPANRMSTLGVMGNDDVPGINILNTIDVPYTFDEIKNAWKNAKDRFEHTSILSVPRGKLENLVYNGEMTIDEAKYTASKKTTTPYFIDCFRHFLEETK
ncbi:hypothetical protein GOV13_03095 [Candidatus Pacearchaeota archaeon]|nr:hypothetical protein [Candidatus Pacearchaeota archaeon]